MTHGPGLVTFFVELQAHAMKSLEVSYTLYEAMPWVDVQYAFAKEMTADAIEALYVAFPFQLSEARLRYESGGAVVEAEKDQLPIACRDFMSVQGWMDLSNDDRGITLALPDTPLICWGEFPVGSYAEHAPVGSSFLLSWVMNNYWHANFKANQAGRLVTRYRIVPHCNPFDVAVAVQIGASAGLPLFASALTCGEAGTLDTPTRDLPPTQQLLQLEPNSVRLVQVRAVTQDIHELTWHVDLQPLCSVSGGKIRFPAFGPVVALWRCSLDGTTKLRALATTADGAGLWDGEAGEIVSLRIRCRSQVSES